MEDLDCAGCLGKCKVCVNDGVSNSANDQKEKIENNTQESALSKFINAVVPKVAILSL